MHTSLELDETIFIPVLLLGPLISAVTKIQIYLGG